MARAASRCWATIGVFGGDRTCEVLRERVHCRECDVLVLAADMLLARAGPGTVTMVDEVQVHERLVMITFEVGGQALALEVAQLIEVGDERTVRRVPHRPGPIFAGMVNVKGRLEPCFSLEAALGLPRSDMRTPRLVVIGRAGHVCAFHVSKLALLEVERRSVSDPPATISSAFDAHVRGLVHLDGRAYAWLDGDRLLVTLERSLG